MGKREYPQLHNRNFLYQKYWVENLSLREIAWQVGCDDVSVHDAMERLGISRRTVSEAQKVSWATKRKGRYPQLYDKNWLEERYFSDGLNKDEIASLVGCGRDAVLSAFKRLSIKSRSKKEIQRTENFRDGARERRRKQKLPTYDTFIERVFKEIALQLGVNIEYTSNGSFWIGKGKRSLNPDFIIRDLKIAIFVNGDYWHSPLLNKKLKSNRTATHQEKVCRRYRWKAIIIWESDLRREDAKDFVVFLFKKHGIL